jgi:hypothetical protein
MKSCAGITMRYGSEDILRKVAVSANAFIGK